MSPAKPQADRSAQPVHVALPGKSNKQRRIRFSHPIATFLRDDGYQSKSPPNDEISPHPFPQHGLGSGGSAGDDDQNRLLPSGEGTVQANDFQVPLESSTSTQPLIKSGATATRSCANCEAINTCRWCHDGKGRWVCNACHVYTRRSGRRRSPSSLRSKDLKISGMTVDYEDSDASFQANDCNKIQDIENHGGEIRETNALLTSTCTTATSDHDDEDDKEQILTEVTAHLEHFVASQRRAMSVLKDALALNMNLLPCTIMNAAMDARLAMNDTHSFGFLPAAQMKGGLLSPRSLVALQNATEDAVHHAQTTALCFQRQQQGI